MKFAAYICFFIFGVLTVQPAFNSPQVNMPKTGCCKKDRCDKTANEQKKQKDNCENRNCNPLMACVYGNFFLLEKQFISFDLPQTGSEKKITGNDNRVVRNSSDCWHPPRVYESNFS
jgi:hypothetical protein